MIIIPTFQDRTARYTIEIELAGTPYNLFFSWNTREESWYMNIRDSEETPILTGIKLVPVYLLLEQYRAYENLPAGDFILWDLNQDSTDDNVTFDNFGERYQLLFFSDDEIEAGEVA